MEGGRRKKIGGGKERRKGKERKKSKKSSYRYLGFHLKLGGQFFQSLHLPPPLLHLPPQLTHLPPLPLQHLHGNLHKRECVECLRLCQ